MANPFTIDTGFGQFVLPALGSLSDQIVRNREAERNNTMRIAAEDRQEQRLLGAEQRQLDNRMSEIDYINQLRLGAAEEERQRQIEQQRIEQAEQQKKNAEISDLVESGSVLDMAKFMATNPEYANQIDKAVSYKNKQTQRNLVDSSLDILRGKDPKEVIKARAAVVASAGGDPSDTLDAANQTPEELKANAKLAVSRYGTEQDQKLADELLGVKSKEDLQKKKLQTEIDAKRAEEERTAAAEKEDKQKATALASEASQIARELASDEGLSSVTGSRLYLENTPTSAESQDIINKAQRLESLLTYENLGLMSGVLTDRDIAFLGRIGSGINISDSGILGTPKEVEERLQEIADRIDSKLGGGSPSGNGKAPELSPSARKYLDTK